MGLASPCRVYRADFVILRNARLLGTPDEECWPGVTGLPDFKSSFPQWSPKDLKGSVSGMNDVSADLLSVSIGLILGE